MKEIIFATSNNAKLAQFQFVIDHEHFPIALVGGRAVYGDKAKYEEIGETVDVVARNGALHVAKNISKPVITEDTDFRINALDGAPGIRAGEFLKNFGRAEILLRMESKTDRRATITSAVGYATPEGFVKVFVNTVHGTIALEEKAGDFPDWVAPTVDNSFGGGYNAIFIPDGFDRTLAEISPADALPFSYREVNFSNVIQYVLNS